MTDNVSILIGCSALQVLSTKKMHTIDQKKSKKYENASSKALGYPPRVYSKTSRTGLQEPTRSRRRLSTKNNEERKEQKRPDCWSLALRQYLPLANNSRLRTTNRVLMFTLLRYYFFSAIAACAIFRYKCSLSVHIPFMKNLSIIASLPSIQVFFQMPLKSLFSASYPCRCFLQLLRSHGL